MQCFGCGSLLRPHRQCLCSHHPLLGEGWCLFPLKLGQGGSVYRVRGTETVADIATEWGVSVASVQQMNPGLMLQPGTAVKIPVRVDGGVSGIAYRVPLGEYAVVFDVTEYGLRHDDEDAQQVCWFGNRGQFDDFHGTVADVGANVGAFAAFALLLGANKVECYEPTPDTGKLLEYNASVLNERYKDRPGITVNHCALLGTEQERTTLYAKIPDRGKRAYPSCNSTEKIGNGKAGNIVGEVAAKNFAGEMNRIQPRVLKMDVEGAEYGLLENWKPLDCVEVLCLELHGSSEDKQSRQLKVMRQYADWHVHRAPPRKDAKRPAFVVVFEKTCRPHVFANPEGVSVCLQRLGW